MHINLQFDAETARGQDSYSEGSESVETGGDSVENTQSEQQLQKMTQP